MLVQAVSKNIEIKVSKYLVVALGYLYLYLGGLNNPQFLWVFIFVSARNHLEYLGPNVKNEGKY